MAIIKNKISKNYTVLPNQVVLNRTLSDGDFRLLVLLYYLPDNMKINQKKLAEKVGCNRRNLNSKLNRIKNAGFLKITQFGDDFIYELIVDGVSIDDVCSELDVSASDTGDVSADDTDGMSVNDSYNKYYNNKYYNNKNNNPNPSSWKDKNYFEDTELNDLFLDFLDLRKKIKAVNSDRAINNLVNKLNKYDDETKKQMINNSITNSWKDVYEIKGAKPIKEVEDPIVREEIYDGVVYGITKKGDRVSLRLVNDSRPRNN